LQPETDELELISPCPIYVRASAPL
jgi:hypothetical protein